MKSKFEIYALAVCFASIMCLIVSIGIIGYAIFEIATPNLTMPAYQYEKFQTNEAYWESQSRSSDGKPPMPAQEVLTQQRVEAWNLALKAEQKGGYQAFIKCLMFILSSGMALLIHWKMAKRSVNSTPA